MSKYHQAADVLKRHAVKYEALMSAAKALDEIGSLDQAATECKAAAEAAKAELHGVEADLAKAKATLAEFKDKFSVAQATAQTKIDGMLAGADYESQQRIAAATEVAEQIEAAANAQASGILANAFADHEAKAIEKRTLEQQISANLDTLADQKAQAEDLEKRIAKAQASIAKLLG